MLDPEGRLPIGKAFTTPDRIFAGMAGALALVAGDLGLPVADLLGQSDILIYGTTRATNAVVTKRTAKTACLTTRGFRNTLVFKEGGKHGPDDYSTDYSDPYIPRRYSFELTKRIGAGGGSIAWIAAGFNIMPIARELGCDAVVLPRLTSALSACGMQYSDIVFEATRSRRPGAAQRAERLGEPAEGA